MLLNLYTYKGKKDSLIGPWVSIGYIVNDDNITNETLERFIPKLPYIYNYRKNLNKYNNYLNNTNIFIKSISSYEINNLGEYSIFLSYKKIISEAKLYLKNEEVLTINKFSKPLQWYERLACIYSVFIRNSYLTRISSIDFDYLYLDSDLEYHLYLLKDLKYLPPKYLVYKCLKYFKYINPKPKWFIQEIDYINSYLKIKIL